MTYLLCGLLIIGQHKLKIEFYWETQDRKYLFLKKKKKDRKYLIFFSSVLVVNLRHGWPNFIVGD